MCIEPYMELFSFSLETTFMPSEAKSTYSHITNKKYPPEWVCMDSLVINQWGFSYFSRYSNIQMSVYSWLVEI